MMAIDKYPICAQCVLSQCALGIVDNDISALGSGAQPTPPVVWFVGEAPGGKELSEGYPFAGASGELLRRALDEFGLTKHAYLTNAILCVPPNELRNEEKWWSVERVKCYHVLHSKLRATSPAVIVALGRAAMAHILGKDKNIALGRRVEVEFIVNEGGRAVVKKIPVYFTYNPAFLIRNPDPSYYNSFRKVLAAVRAEIKTLEGELPAPEALLSGAVVASAHNEELESFLHSLELRYAHLEEDGRLRVVVDIEVGSPHQGSFDSKSPSSLVVLVGIGDGHGRYTKLFLLYDPDARRPILNLHDFRALRDMVFNPRIVKIMHNASFELMWFMRAFNDIPQPNTFVDTMLLAHALDENKPSYSLAALVQEYVPDNPFLNWKDWLDAYTTESGLNACFVPVDKLAMYNRADVILTALLYQRLVAELRSLPERLATMVRHFIVNVANPIAIVVAHMSGTGIPASLDSEQEVRAMLKSAELEVLTKLREAAPTITNFNSTQQLVRYLLERGVTEIEEFKTKKGNYSLTKDVIDKLCDMRPDVEFLQLLKEYREVVKCESTFLRKIPEWVDSQTGRIYPNIHPTGTKTGRLSTSNPPLQNYPSTKKSIGKIIRKIFRAPDGYVFIVCDAKQHELRVLAIKSGDENLRYAFLSGEDVHKVNAARILGKPLSEITEQERQIGKKFSFAAVYGVSEQGAARIFNLSEEESRQLLEQMRAAFPTALGYIRYVQERALKFPNIVHTALGRCRRPLWGLNSAARLQRDDNPAIERAKRQAGNFVIQAEASDLWCLVAYHILLELHKRGYTAVGDDGVPRANIALLIHDSIILVCARELVNDVLDIIKRSIAIVSYRFHTEELPITAEFAVHEPSLGDEPTLEGEWSVDDIKEEIERWLASVAKVPPRYKLFRDDYLEQLYVNPDVERGRATNGG